MTPVDISYCKTQWQIPDDVTNVVTRERIMLTLCGDVYVFQADCVSELTHVNPLLRPSAADLLRGSIFLLDDEDDEVWFFQCLHLLSVSVLSRYN